MRLELQAVTAGYGSRTVLDRIDLSIAGAGFVGVLGPNGCGKTTLLRVLSGVLRPRLGEVRLDDRRMDVIPRRQIARRLACLSQEPSVDFAFTVRELVGLGRSPHRSTAGNSLPADRTAVDHVIERTGLAALADRPITRLSGGERRRAWIAMCLAQQPETLLLDEPTSHLDVGQQFAVLDLIAGLGRREGMGVVAVFHDLNLAAQYCDRLVVVQRGRIVADGTSEEVLTPGLLDGVFGIEALVHRSPATGRSLVAPTGRGPRPGDPAITSASSRPSCPASSRPSPGRP